jgi:HAD superfamily hydrolase (TIGR01490 family)
VEKIAAFFDVDETVIHVKSMFDFYDFWCRKQGLNEVLENYMSCFRLDVINGKSREALNRDYYRQYTGVSYAELIEAGEQWFKAKRETRFFIQATIEVLKKHQRQGITPVFISGSMYPILAPIADYLGVPDVLGAPVVVDSSGKMTGEIGQPQTIGPGKRDVLLNYCRQSEIDPSVCYAYGDDMTDIPMLEATGHPTCVGNNPRLLEYAHDQGWHRI